MPIRVNLLIGCTATGKSEVGLELARRCGGEIVSVDSMQIYRRMDIGTAKPSPQVRAEVPHHVIDVVEPWEQYSLGRFVADAGAATGGIAARGRPVIAVGGTMLYVQGLTQGVFEGPSADPALRREIRERAAREGVPALHAELAKIDPQAAGRIHPNDLRRIERALEVYRLTGTPISELQTQWGQTRAAFDCRIAALRRPKEEINGRINARVKKMIAAGLVEEVRELLAEPRGIGRQAGEAVGYAEIIRHLRGELPLEDAVEEIKINTRHLAKHQRTWMRRIRGIRFVDVSGDEPVAAICERVLSVWESAAAG